MYELLYFFFKFLPLSFLYLCNAQVPISIVIILVTVISPIIINLVRIKREHRIACIYIFFRVQSYA